MRGPAVQREIELKWEARPDDFDRLLTHPALGDALEGPRVQSLRSVYFDTLDQALREAGISLRIREAGEQLMQTVKSSRASNGIALARDEWEMPVHSREPDLASIPDPSLRPLIDLKDAIRPLITIDVRRTAVTVRHEESVMEIALDRGSVLVAGEARPFAEVEIELKDGRPRDLFHLARALADAAPLRLSFLTKSDRGYGALNEATAHKAEPIKLKRRMTSGEAFQVIASSCLRHLMANEPDVRERREPEAVHQMRVALRRLRAAIALFKPVLDDGRDDDITGELKWMADRLGEARDLDVYIAQTLEPARDRHRGDRDFEALVALSEERRRRAYDAVQEMIASPRFLNGVIETAAWIEAGDWLTREGNVEHARERPIAIHALDELSRRWRKIRKHGRKLAALAPEERHRLRIGIKKLRYATEFFDNLFKGRAARKARKAARDVLEELQDTLGELNDIAAGADAALSPEAEALRLEQPARIDALLASAEERYRAFAGLKPFWTRSK